ncbi:MAG: PilZ domain-containing protein [Planctomycetes bacterium]|nr:PilZ domain-containing protein [Planctomycetota bacterium]
MTSYRELGEIEVRDVLDAAAGRHIPIVVTQQVDQVWQNIRCRLVSAGDYEITMEILDVAEDDLVRVPNSGESIGISFKFGHHKHLFTATVLASFPRGPMDRQVADMLVVSYPRMVERVQRRAFTRVVIPPERVVRVAFWLGSRRHEPAGGDAKKPVWTARVVDLSAGGFQAKASADVAYGLEAGDSLGVRLTFGPDDVPIHADAQFRRALSVNDCDEVLLGFQFMALGHTAESRKALHMLSRHVQDYQQMQTRMRART